ncbi:MAG TPA: sugar phosphate isomerase/epimerase [Bryobacteraceae bacterium]|nr:sugar phosphate isomerase/epimerase [Bryobacteraceae bacterium]
MKPQATRRTFLGALGLAAAVPPVNAAAPAAAEDIKLGVASYSLRMFQRALAIRMIKDLGVQYVNIKEFHLPYRSTPEELTKGAAEFTRAGINIVGGGTIYLQKDDDEDIRKYFEYAKACGMTLMVIGPTAQTLPRIEKFVKEYNIKVAVHNHGPEDKHFPSPEVALKALEGMDPRMGVCVDVGHTTRTGSSPVESFRRAGARLLDVHIKDLTDLMNARTQVAVGDGTMPVVDIFKELKKMNFQGYVNLEYEINGDDPLPGMQKSFAYMRGVLAGLRG